MKCNGKEIEASESILQHTLIHDKIRESRIKSICKEKGVSYTIVNNIVSPYLKDCADIEIYGMDKEYTLNSGGQIFASKNFWSGEKMRENKSHKLKWLTIAIASATLIVSIITLLIQCL